MEFVSKKFKEFKAFVSIRGALNNPGKFEIEI